jgi:hypothetical protein
MDDRHVTAFEPMNANLVVLSPGYASSRAITVEKSGSAAPWSLGDLEAEMALFHSTFTRTPTCYLRPWKSARNGQTGDQLEVRISTLLAWELSRRWTRDSVMTEFTTPSGRIDVFVHHSVLAPGFGPCVIEVKVLRSHSNRRKYPDEQPIWWAMKGVVQADLYRQETEAATAYLLCFDAREANESIPEVEKLALMLDVKCSRYFMYRSADALHADNLAGAGV